MGKFSNTKHLHAICLKFGDIFFTSLAKLLLEANASICSAMKEILPLYLRKFSAFVMILII